MVKALSRITASPHLNFLSGLILLGTSGVEIWDSFHEFSLGAHHGVAIFGLIQVIRFIPEIFHGLKECAEGEEGLCR